MTYPGFNNDICGKTLKRCFRSKKKAMNVAAMNEKITLYTYKCDWCGDWHLTKSNPKYYKGKSDGDRSNGKNKNR